MDHIRRISVDLSAAGNTNIINFPLCTAAIERFTGTTGSVVLSPVPTDTDPQAIVLTPGQGVTLPYLGDKHPRQWYIINRTAQSGQTLVLVVGAPGTVVTPGYTSAAGSANAENQTTQIAYEASMDTTLAAIEAELANKTSLAYGQATVGVAAAQLAAQAVADGFELLLKSAIANTGKIYIGVSGVLTTTGFELSAGESISLRVTNLNVLYAIADAAAQTLCWCVEKAA